MSKVSVIIAAFNVEEYIAESIGSVVSQTLKDIEIVVVDDCSTDRTPEIIEQFAALDSRIKVVRHEVNKSLMQVRQTGFRHSTGDYIIFLDGDDKLSVDACEKAYKGIVSEGVEVMQFDMELLIMDSEASDADTEKALRDALHSVENKVISISPAGLLDEKQVGGTINFNVWNKIYKRELLEKANEHIPSEYVNMAEDVFYSYIILFFAKSYSFLPERLYHYRFGCGMSTTRTLSERQLAAIAKNAYVYSYLKNWTKRMDAEKDCRKALERVHHQLYNHIINTFFYKLQKSQKNRFASMVQQYGDMDDIVLAFSHFLYEKRVLSDKLATECAPLEMFSVTKTQPKTIGVYYFRMYNGGVENVISSLTDTWVKSGYQVVIFTDEAPNRNDYPINPQVKRVIVPAMKNYKFATQKERISKFRAALLENQIDIMVYNAWIDPQFLLDAMTVKSCGIALAVHTHNLFCCETDSSDEMVAYRYSVLTKAYEMADTVITLNDVDTAWWQMFGHRSIKTRNPVQMSLDTAPAKLEGKNILFSGRVDRLQKQTLHAVQVAELVSKKIPDVKLTVVGGCDDQEYKRLIEKYIKDNKLQKTVQMVGYTQDVLPYYQDADVMLCTSKFEGFSLSLTESKVCGLPLVCYYLSNWDLARAPKGMVNVPQDDIYAAADAIVEILQNDELKHRMGKEARESAEEWLSFDLAAHWNMIFAKTLEPRTHLNSMEIQSADQAAIDIAVTHYSEGLYKRAMAPASAVADGELLAECKKLINMLNEIGSSESYKLGLFLTAIPRKIKNWLKRKPKED
jgi:glycosyltransferase involved in cell wall biosynthesis